jgi:hypothetical protein
MKRAIKIKKYHNMNKSTLYFIGHGKYLSSFFLKSLPTISLSNSSAFSSPLYDCFVTFSFI